jgi:hypothetical protein
MSYSFSQPNLQSARVSASGAKVAESTQFGGDRSQHLWVAGSTEAQFTSQSNTGGSDICVTQVGK